MEKTTNVDPEELNYDSYETEKYDSDIVKVIPGHLELHKGIDRIMKEYAESREIKKVLELGIGTGLTSKRLFEIIPDMQLVAIDFSKTMIDGARNRLKGCNVEFIEGDYSKVDFGSDFDMIISVISIHHQNNEGKRLVFKKIYDSLKKGGIFVFGDLVTYRNKEEAEENEKKHFEFLVENAEDEKSLEEWTHHHRVLNLLAPIEDQIEWLEELGFSVQVKFKKYNTALILAKK